MTAMAATAFTLSVGDGATTETFAELGGLTTHRLQLSKNAARFHHAANDTAWENAAAETGRQSLRLWAQGICTGNAAEEILRGHAFANTVCNLRIALGNGDTVSGAFSIRNFERSAGMEGAVEYSLTLHSAGEITFQAA